MDNGKELDGDCCRCSSESEVPSYGCAEKKMVLTKREQEVLGRIREAALQARTIKEKLRALSPADRDHGHAEVEHRELRALREELENERVAAAEERMRYLGHL
ncbi:MAG: hypothetical protein AAGU11_17665 [Syntrophobacteraceae bacterium]